MQFWAVLGQRMHTKYSHGVWEHFPLPANPILKNELFEHFPKALHLNNRPSFDLASPMDLPGQVGPNHCPVSIDGSSVYNLGIVDSSHLFPGPLKLAPRPLPVGTPSECNSVGTLCQSSHSPTHPILLFPHPGAGGIKDLEHGQGPGPNRFLWP